MKRICSLSAKRRRPPLRLWQPKKSILLCTAPGETEILYISCIPWINYTHFVRTIEDASKDNVPRISWGKYVRDRDGRLMMSFSVQVHHALMDGYHVGMYFEKLEAWLSSIPEQTSGKDGISDERSTVQ